MTPRENALLAYRHQPHPSVPNFFTDFDIWDSFGERYFGPGEGKDWFGVSWTHVPEMNSQTETPGQELLAILWGAAGGLAAGSLLCGLTACFRR